MEYPVSGSSIKLRQIIEKAIRDETITRDDYDKIIQVAVDDNVVDRQEEALLAQFQQMIASGVIKIKRK